MAKMVNATFASQNQGVIITRQMWHLPCLPQIYFSIFTNLRHIHWEQILCKSIFSSRDATSFLATCRAITPFFGCCLCTFCSFALFSFLLHICIYSYSSSTFLEELTCVIILFIFDNFGGTHESLRLHFLKKRSDASRTRAFTLCTGHSRWRKTIKASIKI